MSTNKHSLLQSTALFSSALLCVAVFDATAARSAEPAPVSAPQVGDAIKEIVVTAEKRQEPMRNVPIAVTALSAEDLATKGVAAVTSLNTQVPGLQFTTVANEGSPRIRGVGTQIASGGNENAVATYVDGVYYASSISSVLAFNNVSQIAVLKGPQGTLFGRNATGGVIQITTRDPSRQFSADASVTYGNFNTIGTDIYVTGGITQNLAADIALHYQDQQDGFGINQATGAHVGQGHDTAVRSKWKAILGDSTTGTLILDYEHSYSDGPAYRFISGELGAFAGGEPFTGRPWDIGGPYQPRSVLDQGGISFDLEHDFGDVKLVSISAYRRSNWLGVVGDTIYSFVNLKEPEDQVSEEVRLQSNGLGRLKWLVGFYYFNGSSGYEPVTVLIPAEGNLGILVNSKQPTTSYAGFAQGTYALTPDTNLTLGARVTTDNKSFDGVGSITVETPFGPFVIPQGPVSFKASTTAPTWRASLDHHFTPNLMAYLSYNRGFKSGGYNPQNVASPSYFKPETLGAFETGLKADWFNHRLRLNGAAFYYNYRNIQLNRFIHSLQTIYNGKSATIYGLDFDATAIPIHNLTLTWGVSLLHDRLGDFPISTTLYNPATGVTFGPDISASGKRLPTTPDATTNIGADYRMPMRTGSLDFSVNGFLSSRWYADVDNRLSQGPYGVLSSTVTWQIDNEGKYSVRFWGLNLTNAVYAAQLGDQPPTDFVNMAPPRTFGVTIRARY